MHVYERLLKDDNNDGKNLVYFVDGLGGEGHHSFNNVVEDGSQFQFTGKDGAMKVIENSSSILFQFYSVNQLTSTRDTYEITDPNPVQLTSFNAHFDGLTVNLNWTTVTEIDNYGFDIEHSNDNLNWIKIGFVRGHGYSNIPHNYYFIDDNLNSSGWHYYRLKQIDNDGTSEYSTVIRTEVISPGKFILRQNYPNPFNPSTVIEYSIPSAGLVSLEVYDILGKKVETLVNEYQNGGSYKIIFRRKDLSSGIYFYRLIVSQNNSPNLIIFSQTKSLVLQK